jgi:stage II sporulation protein D
MYDRTMRALALALALVVPLASSGPAEPEVTVSLFSKLNPHRIRVEGGASPSVLEAQGGALRVDGKTVRQPYVLPQGDWKLTPRPGDTRELHGALSAWGEAGEVVLVATLSLEDYVAEAVASETVPWTPDAALRAQAIVTRSWVLAAGTRHARAQVCDQSHCQVLLRRGVSEHRPRCRAAAEATGGCVLRLPRDRWRSPSTTPRAAVPRKTPPWSSGRDGSGLGALIPPAPSPSRDIGCPARSWTTLVPLADLERELGRVLGLPATQRVTLKDVEFVRGPGGRIVVVRHRPSGRFGSGDALARALDRPEGWGHVWSARFDVHPQGGLVALHGSGYGHGVGLCQTGSRGPRPQGRRCRDDPSRLLPGRPVGAD